MELTRFFSKISKHDVALAGGKGASLGEMTQAKIPVPNGFVILADSFEKFLEETDLNVELDSILDQVNHKEMESIETASEKIKALILGAKMPKYIETQIQKDFKELNTKYVAVRSSATSEDSSSAAWAGQLDSFLNTTKKDLLDKVKRCWASLFTPRAIFYRFEKGLHNTKISVAVVVQKMVESEISGIAFSVHPVTQDRNQLIIEAGFGLGEAIVSGQITPDSYVVEKVPRRIIDKNVSEQERGLFKIEGGGNEWKNVTDKGAQQKLSDKQIMELSETILRIEKHYAFPCDIEWAFEGGKFFIVQSRPITTLTDKENDKEMPSAETKETFKKKSKKKDNEGKKTEKKEQIQKNEVKLEEITPLLKSKKEIQQFPSTILPLLCATESATYMKKALGFTYDNFYFEFTGGYANMCYFSKNNHEVADKLMREYGKDKSYFKKAKQLYEKIYAKEQQKNLEKKEKYFKDKNSQNLYDWIEQATLLPAKGVGLAHLIEAISMTKTHALKDQLAEKIKDPQELSNALNTLTSPEKTSFFAKYQLALKNAFTEKNKEKQKKLLEKVVNTYSWIKNGYTGKKELTIQELFEQKGNLQDVKEINPKEIQKQKETIKKKSALSKETIELAELFSFLTTWQDERKEAILKGITEICDAIKELSNYTGISEEKLLLLTPDEIRNKRFLEPKILEELAEREKYFFVFYSANKKPEYALFFGEENKKKIQEITKEENQVNIDSIYGTCASTGKVIGKVQICRNINEINNFEKGNILVASMTRPEYLPAMKKSIAVVTDEGGLTCHAAIISRELNIPCIIGTKYATKVLKNGDLIEVRANHGQIIILNRTGEEKDFQKLKDYLEITPLDIKTAKCNCTIIGTVFKSYVDPKSICGGYGTVFILYNNLILSQDIVQEKMDSLERNIWETSIKNRAVLKQWITTANKVQKQLDKFALNAEQLKTLNNAKLANYFNKVIEKSLEWWLYGAVGEEKGLIVEEKIIPELVRANKISEEEAREYIMVTTTPKIPSIFSKEREAFLDLCKEASQNKELLKITEKKKLTLEEKQFLNKVKKYSKDFFFAGTDFYDSQRTDTEGVLNRIREQLKKQNSSRITEELKTLKNNIPSLLKKQKTMKNKLKLTKDVINYLWYFSEMQKWIDTRKHSMTKQFKYINNVLAETAKRKKLSYGQVAKLFSEEIIELLKGDLSVLKQANKRDPSVFIRKANTPMKEYNGEEAREIIRLIKKTNIQNETIKGTVASKGGQKIVTGKARIVMNPTINPFEEGEILVTTMTRIEFVPIMNKAKAIITDEGGIACHAAIVSRELGVPCIIGTKNATHTLKSGDEVELNLETGEVKVLKKNKNFDLNEIKKLNLSLEHIDCRWLYLDIPSYCFTKPFMNSTFPFSFVAPYINGIEMDWVTDKSDHQRISKNLLENDTKNNNFFFDLHKKWLKRLEKMFSFYYDENDKNYSILSDKELKKKLEEIWKFYTKEAVFPAMIDGFMFYADERLNNLMKEFALNKKTKETSNNLFNVLSAPTDESFLNKAENDLIKIASEKKKGKNIEELAEKHCKSFSYINASYGDYKPYTKKDVMDKIEELLKQNTLEQTFPGRENKKAKKQLLKKYPFYKKALQLIILSELFTKWQDERKQTTQTHICLELKIINEISKRKKININLLKACHYEELYKILDEKNVPEGALKRFKEPTIAFFVDGKIVLEIGGEKAFNFIESIKGKHDSNITQIYGLVAFAGKVVGKAKIVRTFADSKKIKEGDILVIPMTRPEHTPIMKKAAAIVTDDGGITCHAAIMARELKKPCIIGTKIATQVIQDGDLIEVKANHGQVTILEKKVKKQRAN